MSKNQNYKYIEEFGYIPKDWEIIKLKNLTTIITKQTGFDYAATIKPSLIMDNIGDVCPFIQNKDFDGCNINLNTDYYIPMDIVDKFPKITLDKPSILISISGKVGNIGYYNLSIKSFIGGAVGICKLKENINGKYILYYLQSALGQKCILGYVKASSHLNITVQDIRTAPILFPPSPEQEKIAEVLSDVDSLIERTQQLIDKKKNLKIATMQKLLTPKQNWEKAKLKNIGGNIYQPQTISTNMFKISGYPVFGANGIIGYYDRYNHITPQVTITCRGNSCGTINMSLPYSWITGNAMVLNVDKINFNKKFLFYLLSNKDLSVLITGSGQPQIVRSSLEKFEIDYPKKEEQDKIATILSDMDTEIEKLEQELSKYKDLKIGMMQELLTGKVRLI